MVAKLITQKQFKGVKEARCRRRLSSNKYDCNIVTKNGGFIEKKIDSFFLRKGNNYVYSKEVVIKPNEKQRLNCKLQYFSSNKKEKFITCE